MQRVMAYGSATWPMRVEELRGLERAERMMIRWLCEVTLKNRCKSEELRKRLDNEDVADVIRKSKLRWFGYLERKEGGDWVSAIHHAEIWLSQKMLESVGQEKGRGILWRTI